MRNNSASLGRVGKVSTKSVDCGGGGDTVLFGQLEAKASREGEGDTPMSRDIILLINGVIYQASPWPKQMPNPGKNKYLVYRESECVATAKTKKEFEEKCRDGWYDACASEVTAP